MTQNKREYNSYTNEYEQKINEALTAQQNASVSTRVLTKDINDSTMYLKVVQDVHGNLANLKRELINLSKIPNAYVLFLGDVSTNGNLEGFDHANVYGNLKTPEEEIFSFINLLRQDGIDTQRMMVGYLDGNHELRIEKKTSIRPGKIVCESIGAPHLYAQNAAKLVFNLKDPKDQAKTITVTGLARHGENTPTNAGSSVEKNIQNSMILGVDFVLTGHTHIFSYGNTNVKVKGLKGTIQKPVFSGNFGSYQMGASYADRAGYQMTSIPNGELLRISANAKENEETKVCIDMISIKDILTSRTNDCIDKTLKYLQVAEKQNYESKSDIIQAYKDISKKVSKIATNGKKAIKTHSDTVFFMPWAGFQIGHDGVKNEDEIDKAVEIAKKLNNCKIILNGDMIHYKKADTFSQKKYAKYPDDSFAFLGQLAEKLEPIKDKIICYNSGIEETNIMKYHGDDLAKFAMNRLQMDESLVYEKYDKTKYKMEQKKIQNKMVEDYNKEVLKKECEKFKNDQDKMQDFNDFIEENYAKKKYDKEEVFKSYVATELRKDGKLLSVADTQKINKKFPLSEIDLRKPNENLIQNMLCVMLGINPKKILINPNYNTQKECIIRLYTEEGKSEPIYLLGGYSTSGAGRGSQESNLNRLQSQNLGYDIYYVNSKLGGEYITKTTSVFADEFGNTKRKDVYHICAARFDGERKFINNTTSQNRIYSIKRVEKDELIKKHEREGLSMFKSNGDYTIIANSIDYDSAFANQDVEHSILSKLIKDSYNKKYKEFLENKKQKSFDVETIFEKDIKQNLKEKEQKAKQQKNKNQTFEM